MHQKGLIGLLALSLASIAIMAALGPPSTLFIVAISLAFAAAAFVIAVHTPERILARATVAALLLGTACFAATMLEEFLLGGTPLNGKMTELGYFVGSHGRYRLVSEAVYRCSLLFNIGVIVFWPTMIGVVAVNRSRRGPSQNQRTTL